MGNVVARTENLATEAIDDGLLVYDLVSNDVHWLDPTVTEVWRLADGSRTADEIAVTAGVSDGDVLVSLDKLVDLGLATEPEGLTRRLMIRKVALTAGVAAVAGPIISSVVAPTAAFANTSTCDATPCSGTGTTKGGAKSSANAVCNSGPNVPNNCRSTSTCTCTATGSGSSFSCTGTCVY